MYTTRCSIFLEADSHIAIGCNAIYNTRRCIQFVGSGGGEVVIGDCREGGRIVFSKGGSIAAAYLGALYGRLWTIRNQTPGCTHSRVCSVDDYVESVRASWLHHRIEVSVKFKLDAELED